MDLEVEDRNATLAARKPFPQESGHMIGPVSTETLDFQEMLDSLPVAFYATDAEGWLTYFNRAAVALSGRVPEIGTDRWSVAWKLFSPDAAPLPLDQSSLAALLMGKEFKAGQECIGERPDGSRFWFTPHPTILRGMNGQITGGLNMLVDVTEQKMSAAPREAEFRTIFDTSPECVKVVAPDGKFLQINASGLAMFGASSAQALIGKNVHDLVAPEDRERFREFNERVCAGEKASLEFDIVGLAGERRHVETHAAPLTLPDGSTVQLGVTRNVLDRKLSERAALLLSAIVDSSDDAIISKDLNGTITSWNRSAERLFGYTAEEAIGQPVAALLIPADRQGEEAAILARLRNGERVDHFETKRRRKDGTPVDISLTVSPVKDSSGRIIGASKIARDISEQIRYQQELRQANDSLARSNADLEHFAWSASHDLQEPLRMVSAYSQMLRAKFENQLGSAGDQFIGFVIEGASRMEQLLRDLRTYTHAAIGNDEAPPLVSSETAIERSIVNLKAAIDESGAEITYDPLPPVRIHEFQLEQLFQNILGNAIRYRGEEPPRIHASAEADGNAWRFLVQDNGIGISPEYKEQIFGIFKRLHAFSEYPGTGMGLAICQRIVERASGRIWVESQPGRGSTFFFTLPAAAAC
jgi:PAS domain S-box-containing protein